MKNEFIKVYEDNAGNMFLATFDDYNTNTGTLIYVHAYINPLSQHENLFDDFWAMANNPHVDSAHFDGNHLTDDVYWDIDWQSGFDRMDLVAEANPSVYIRIHYAKMGCMAKDVFKCNFD